MNKRIEKKMRKRDQLAHEQALQETSWGRIQLSLEQVSEAFQGLSVTLRQEGGVWEQQARLGLQKRMKAVDDSVFAGLSKVPLVGQTVARNLHMLATDPHFAQSEGAPAQA